MSDLLRITDGGRTFDLPLAGDRVVLGRADDCDVVLTDAGISREHAELLHERGAWILHDLGSRNGTFIDDAPIDRQRLAAGQRARLGPGVTLEWVPGAAAEVVSAARGRAAGSGRAVRGGAAAGGEEGAAVEREPVADSRPVVPARAAGAAPHPFARMAWTLTPRGGRARIHTLATAITTVGRDPGAGLVLDDESVSRMHARLDREGDALAVTDLKSSNGTTVNGDPVLRAPLAPGDTVSFGDVAFRVDRRVVPAWGRIVAVAGGALTLVLVAVVALWWSRGVEERRDLEDLARRVRVQALASTEAGIAAFGRDEHEIARAHLLYAADLLLLSDLAPRGASLAQPATVFRDIARDLPADLRQFDFARALDPGVLAGSQARLATLTNREYVDHQVRRYSVELGQDPATVPAGFIEAVWGYVSEYERFPGSMRRMLERSRDVQPRIRDLLASRHLPESFCYVAWVESGLDRMQRSPVGALGLWQLMPATAREYGLRVDESDPARDERTHLERSTGAAAEYIAMMLRDQGPEYFMLVLASYNRGHNAIDRAKQRITDPMLKGPQRFWYLVENGLLPTETQGYVPKIFAVRVIAEAPERFGFGTP
jgi:pSer/pThr/pTyr-binding forkhead associated (FHA) protein